MSKDIFLIPKIKKDNLRYKTLYNYMSSYIYNYMTPIYCQENTEYKEYFATEYRKLMIKKLKEQLNISPSINRFNEKFLNKTELSYYNNIKVDLDINYNIDIPENLNNIINFKNKEYLDNIYETYNTDEDILKQFTLDFPRHKIYVNNSICSTIGDIFTILSKYNRYIDLPNDRKTTTFMLSMLLICQSSFYISFIHIYNKINKMKEKYLLNVGENINDIDKTPILNYHLTDTKKVNEIHLTIDDFSLSCTFIASYKVINIYTEKDVYNIKAETLFDLNFDDCLIVYERYNV